MADNEPVASSEDEEMVEDEEREEVSDSMVVAMARQEQTLLFPEYDFDPGVFITAQGTALDEDDIMNASVEYRFDQQQQTRKGRKQRKQRDAEAMQVSATVNPKKAFVAKCKAQITDFRMSVEEANGTVGFRMFDKGSSVADRDNRAFYVSMLGNPGLADRVEGFLDFLAGRDTPAQEDFEDLKNEQPQLLSTS